MAPFIACKPQNLETIQKKAEKKACLHCVKTSYAIQAIKWGFDLVTLNSDTRLLVSSASHSINEFRNGLK